VATLLLPSGGVAGADEGDRILAASLEAAKALAAELPKPGELGPGWLYPWQLTGAARPDGSPATEADYWAGFQRRFFPAGATSEHARAMADRTAQAAEELRQPGFGARDGLISLRQRVRAQVTSAAQKAEDGAAILKAMVLAAPAAGRSGTAAEAEAAQIAMLRAMTSRYDGLSVEALKAAFVADVTLLEKSTRMEYWWSNDWEQARKPSPGPGVWTGVVTVTWSFLSPGRGADVVDLKADGAAALERAVNEAYALLHAKTSPREREALTQRLRGLDATLAGLSGGDAERRARVTEERATAQRALDATAKPITVKVLPRDFGDNAYVIRLSTRPPDGAGSSASIYTGWIRNGPSLVEITFGGTFPEAEMDRLMDKFLVLMDGKTDLYR
jgi:hypothetical protein